MGPESSSGWSLPSLSSLPPATPRSSGGTTPPVSWPTGVPDGRLHLLGGVVIDERGLLLPGGRAIPVRLDEFEDQGLIGVGSYSRVHRVLHRPTGTAMALKKIPLQEDDNTLRQITMELDVLHRSRCEFIVDFYGAFAVEAMVFLCMELVDGPSLDKVIPLGPFPTHVLGRVCHDMVECLHYMKSELDVMHRDVRPSNILVSRHGQIKVCDFGVSARLVNSVAKTYTGTIKYMAPERIDSNPDRPYGVQSDVWSLGISLLEMATSAGPYPGWDTHMPIFKRMQLILTTTPDVDALQQRGHDADLCDLLRRCLQREPERRPLLADLRQHAFAQRHSRANVSQWAASVASPQRSQERLG